MGLLRVLHVNELINVYEFVTNEYKCKWKRNRKVCKEVENIVHLCQSENKKQSRGCCMVTMTEERVDIF